LIISFRRPGSNRLKGFKRGFIMRNNKSQIHSTALGGYTIDGPYFRRSALREALNRFFYWLGA
jgi:hypothetical protein